MDTYLPNVVGPQSALINDSVPDPDDSFIQMIRFVCVLTIVMAFTFGICGYVFA